MVVIVEKLKQETTSARAKQRKFQYEFVERTNSFQLLIHLPFSVIIEGTEISRFQGNNDYRKLQSEVIRKLFELEEIAMIDIEMSGYSIVLIKRSKPKVMWVGELMDRIEAAVVPFITAHNEQIKIM